MYAPNHCFLGIYSVVLARLTDSLSYLNFSTATEGKAVIETQSPFTKNSVAQYRLEFQIFYRLQLSRLNWKVDL